MSTVICQTLMGVYRHLPLLNKLTEADVENGLLRMKYMVPFLLNKTHPVESVFRKIFLLNLFLSIPILSAYFWYVTQVSGEGVTIKGLTFPGVISLIVATCYGSKLHTISLGYVKDEHHSPEAPYIHNSFAVIGLAFFAFLVGLTKVDNIQLTHPEDLFYQYFLLVIAANYLVNVMWMEAIIIFIQHDIFSPKWLRAFWILGIVYLLYKQFIA